MKQRLFQIGILTIILFKATSTFGQELVVKQPLNMGKANTIRNVINIISDDEATLIMYDKFNVHLLEFDAEFREKTNSKFIRPATVYEQILGHNINDNDYHLYFSNKKKNQFFVHSISAVNNKNQWKIIPIKLRKEKYIESLSYNNRFYIFTTVKSSSLLKLYVFEGGQISARKEFDFSDFQFTESTVYSDLYSAITTSEQLRQTVDITKIDHRNPISIEQASKTSILYFIDGKVIISLDNNRIKTNLITINLTDFSTDIKQFFHQLPQCNDTYINTNSFLSDGKLFQVQVCRSALTVQSIDIETQEKFAELNGTLSEGINFNNSLIKQEGGTSFYTQWTDKELVKPKQILRKMTNSEVGISAYSRDDKLVLTIGGYKEVQQSSGIGGFSTMPGGSFSTPGGVVTMPATTFYNPTMYGYSQYKNSRSVYFKSIVDQDSHFHLKGAISENAYDKMRSFEETSSKIKNETIFRIGDAYFFGYFKAKEEVYAIHSFRDDKL